MRYLIATGIVVVGLIAIYFVEFHDFSSEEKVETDTEEAPLQMAGSTESSDAEYNISEEQQQALADLQEEQEHTHEHAELFEGGDLSLDNIENNLSGEEFDYTNAEIEADSDHLENNGTLITIPMEEQVRLLINTNNLWIEITDVSTTNEITYQGETLEADSELLGEADSELSDDLYYIVVTAQVKNEDDTHFMMMNFPKIMTELPVQSQNYNMRRQHDQVALDPFVLTEQFSTEIGAGESGELKIAFLAEEDLLDNTDLYLMNNSMAMKETIIFALE